MQSPFYNTNYSVQRASRIISALFTVLFGLLSTTVAVGWRTGELQERVIHPTAMLTAYTLNQLERHSEIKNISKQTVHEPQSQTKNINVTVTGGNTTSATTSTSTGNNTTTTTKTYTHSAIKQPVAQPKKYSLPVTKDTGYNPPAWFVESSAKSQAKFEAERQQQQADFDAFSAKSKADFEAAKAQSQADFAAKKSAMGF